MRSIAPGASIAPILSDEGRYHRATLITSTSNPRVKHVISLNDRKQRERDRLMLVEGYDPISLALAAGARPTSLFACAPLVKVGNAAFARLRASCLAAGAELVEVNERVFERIAYRDGPDGLLAVFPKPEFRLDELTLSAAPLVLVAERVEKPGNIGAMLRTCDAAGVDAFISCDPLADLSNPNVVRASQGALFSVPIAECAGGEAIEWLRARGVKIFATTPNLARGQAPVSLFDLDLSGPVAIVVGEEKGGLSQAWLTNADAPARIPMLGKINSLNVSISAALCVYEAVRQRTLTRGPAAPSDDARRAS